MRADRFVERQAGCSAGGVLVVIVIMPARQEAGDGLESRPPLRDFVSCGSEAGQLFADGLSGPHGEPTGKADAPADLLRHRVNQPIDESVGRLGVDLDVLHGSFVCGILVEKRRHQIDSGLIVDGRHVDLGVDGHLIAWKPLDHMDPPERSRPVQVTGMELGDELVEAPPRVVGGGNRGTTKVDPEIDAVDRSPTRPSEAAGRGCDDAASGGHGRKAGFERRANRAQVEGPVLGRIEDHQRSEMARLVGSLHRQERCVHAPHRGHRVVSVRRHGPDRATKRIQFSGANGSLTPTG